MPRLELGASRSQSARATNCATLRKLQTIISKQVLFGQINLFSNKQVAKVLALARFLPTAPHSTTTRTNLCRGKDSNLHATIVALALKANVSTIPPPRLEVVLFYMCLFLLRRNVSVASLLLTFLVPSA